MAHRSTNRNIYEEKLNNIHGDSEKYFALLYASPFRQHKLKAARVLQQAETVKKMQAALDKTDASVEAPTEA